MKVSRSLRALARRKAADRKQSRLERRKLRQYYTLVPPSFLEQWHLQLEADATQAETTAIRTLFLANAGGLVALGTLVSNIYPASTLILGAMTVAATTFSLGAVCSLFTQISRAKSLKAMTGLYLAVWTKMDRRHDYRKVIAGEFVDEVATTLSQTFFAVGLLFLCWVGHFMAIEARGSRPVAEVSQATSAPAASLPHQPSSKG